MADAIKKGLLMVVVALASGIVLAGVSKLLRPRIELNISDDIRKAIKAVMPRISGDPDLRTYKLDGKDRDVFICKDDNGEIIGYAFTAEGTGYGGRIKMMVGVEPDFSTLTGMEVLESVETPGLGDKIKDAEWREQFVGLNGKNGVTVVKGAPADRSKGEIQAIPAATISSTAVANAVSADLARIAELAKNDADFPRPPGAR